MANATERKRSTSRKAAQKPDEAPAAAVDHVEQEQAERALREEANKILADLKYEGTLTGEQLRALYPLLSRPIPARYIKHTAAITGKPYESTGIRSVQVQIDRLNAVLGPTHWRKLLHYSTPDGSVCHAHVIVGNDLARAGLEDDQLDPSRYGDGVQAEVLNHVHGWGGHGRGSGKGDLYKGAETNALKRVIAQLGPGREVYTLDVDDDVNLASQPEVKDRPQAAASGGGEADAPDATKALADLLATDDELKPLRERAAKGMEVFNLTDQQRYEQLAAATTERDLNQLLSRIDAALDEPDGAS